jgi:hypothetical protein
MKRRSGVGSQQPRPHKAASPKRRNAKYVTRKRGASIADRETVLARLTCERDEAVLRETANSEILGLISRSPGDLDLVFRAILEHATRICNANFGMLLRFNGSGVRFVLGSGCRASSPSTSKGADHINRCRAATLSA